jgi:hypothetical protein
LTTRLPVASGLNFKRLDVSKRGVDEKEAMGGIDDDAAISTRPNFLLSPVKFDRKGATTAITKASKRDPSRKNKACLKFGISFTPTYSA